MILDPCHSYFNPLGHVLNESEVEHGLESMFKLESLGVEDFSEKNSFDEDHINKFKNAIEFREGKYHVDLPWMEDKLQLLPSNHKVALAVLDRVYEVLKKKQLISAYEDVFKQQLADGIIQEIEVSPSNYHSYKWIPHRPVIKTEQQVTTKIRPVFNCSLRTNSLPSINDAAYTGLDLMSSLFRLLLHFRSNKFVLLADIKQAFLQIKLKSQEDRDRFCFFLEERKGNQDLSVYNYCLWIYFLTFYPQLYH
jgi:hypothetical protein